MKQEYVLPSKRLHQKALKVAKKYRFPPNEPILSFSRGYDSVIRRMNILVCSGIDSMCAYSTFALKLEDK